MIEFVPGKAAASDAERDHQLIALIWEAPTGVGHVRPPNTIRFVIDDERSDGPSWHDDQRVAIAGAVAALLLLALLIYGVVRVSEDSSTPRPGVVLPGTSTVTSPTHSSGLKTLPSTSYALPSAQTTAPAPTPEPPSEPGPPNVDPPTTIYNPYTTTTTTNAGHI